MLHGYVDTLTDQEHQVMRRAPRDEGHAAMMYTARSESNEATLDGGAAWWYRTTILEQRAQHARPYTAATDARWWHARHRGQGAGAEQPA